MSTHRKDFPLLSQKINQQAIVYFDNASTTQKPQVVIDAIRDYYQKDNSNVHRGINPLSEEATRQYEAARLKVADFIKSSKEDIIFTKGATESINIIARSWAQNNLKKSDTILLSLAEHHANIVPWMQLQTQIGFKIKWLPLTKDGSLDIKAFQSIIQKTKVKLLAITYVSNVLGIINPLEKIIKEAKNKGTMVVVDASQAAAHLPLNVLKLNCDFLTLSSHKVFGPTGVGVLYAKKEILANMSAWLGGGNMIETVTLKGFTEAPLPDKLEAGTPNIAGVIGFGKAIDYLQKLGLKNIQKQEEELTKYFFTKIKKLPFLDILGSTTTKRLPIFAINIKGVHPHDIADILGELGIITRAGLHCAEPLHTYFGKTSSLRASLAFYNTKAEIDIFLKSLAKIYQKFN